MPRKVFVAGEILTAADVNTNLMDQAVMVFDDSAARGSAIPTPSEGMVTYLKDTNQVQAFTGAVFAPIGTILQVVSTTLPTIFSASVLSAATVSVTGLTASITPSSTTSKILVTASVNAVGAGGSSSASVILKRDGTSVGVGDAAGNRTRVSTFGGVTGGSDAVGSNQSVNFLDSPATTSSVTYSIDLHNVSGSTATLRINHSNNTSDIAVVGRGASTITLMEVAG